MSVDLDLSEDISVSSDIVAEFSRDTLLEAIRTLYEPRHWGLLFSYSLVVLGALPLLEWDVDWPLARRGGDGPTRRGKVQGDLPWEYEANCALLTIYQWAPSIGSAWAPHHCAKPVIRLRVGGRTPNEAVSNWLTSAKALRRLRRSLRAETIQ